MCVLLGVSSADYASLPNDWLFLKILGCVCCSVFLQLTMPAFQMIGCSWRYWDVCVVRCFFSWLCQPSKWLVVLEDIGMCVLLANRCFFSWLCQPSKWLVVLEDIGMCVLLGVSSADYASLPNDWLFLGRLFGSGSIDVCCFQPSRRWRSL